MRPPDLAFAVLLGLSVAAVWPSTGVGDPFGPQRVKSPSYGAINVRDERRDDDSANLLTNPDFESGMEGWKVQAWAKKGHAQVDREERHDGKPSLRVHNPGADNTFVSQTLNVKPLTRYRLSCWIKTRDIKDDQGRGVSGATLWIGGGWQATKAVKNAEEWTYVQLDFDSGARTELQVGPRLGQWGGILTGKAWFSQVSLVELGPGN